METLNDRMPRTGTSGPRGWRWTAAVLALSAGACCAIAQPITQPGRQAPSGVDQSGTVRVDDSFTVELHVRNEDLANVLQLLSLQSQKSIIAGPQVNASVTANLYGVTFYEALDAVLHTYGYGYIEQGNMIYVMTREEIERIQTQNRRAVSRIIRLSFLSAVDAAEYVSPLLSNVGEIRTNGRTQDFSMGDEFPVGGDQYAGQSMMIVYDYEENVNEIASLITQIDTRPEQVLVEATVLQTQLTEANAFGIDFSLIGDLNFSEFVGSPLNVMNRIIAGTRASDGDARGLVSSVGQTAQPGGLKIGIVDNDVAVFMRVLDEVTDTTVLSNPKIMVLNRQQGLVQVGRRIGYLEVTTTDTSTQQNVKFLNTGTQLSFRPWITRDNMIRMELRPEVSRPFLRTVTDSNGRPVTIPDEDTSEIVTNVILREGQTAVLGGLFTESTVAARRQVPFLGDIPIAGAAFRGHDTNVDRAEVIFLVKPTIMSDDRLIEQGQRGMQYVERVRIGSREGLLPFSRERQAGNLLVRAERMAAEGDVDRALFRVRRALALSPQQPDAIRLRERLLSQPTVWPSRSMLEDIISNEVDGRLRSARQQAMAEFTSLIRPDNRWDNLQNQPATTVTGVDTNSTNDPGWTGSGGGWQNDNAGTSGGSGASDTPVGSPQSSNTNQAQPTTAAAAYSWTYMLNAQQAQDTQAGATTPASTQASTQPSSQSSAPTAANTSSSVSPSATPSSVSSTGNTQAQGPATSGQARSAQNPSSSQATTPSARSVQAPSAQSNAGPEMYPFVQAAPTTTASNVPNAQPDANGFYPIFAPATSAQNVPQNAGQRSTASGAAPSGATSTSFGGRYAWIFGIKARGNQASGNPTLVNVQESSSSQNP